MGINSGSLLFKKVFAGKASSDNTVQFFSEPPVTNARLSVFSGDVWTEAHLIPESGIGDITGSVSPGGFTSSGVVKYYSASTFSHIDGTEAGYSVGIKDWIPFNFGDGDTYNYVLIKNDGTRIFPGGVGNNWTFDTEAGVLIFHDGNLSNVSPSTPPKISAYAYTGKKLSDGITTSQLPPSLISGAEQIGSEISGAIDDATGSLLDAFTFISGAAQFDNNDDVIFRNITASNISASSTITATTISASNIKLTGSLDADGDITLDGTLGFNGFNFTEANIASLGTGSTLFGSGALTASLISHSFTGSVSITGSTFTFNGDNVLTTTNVLSNIQSSISGAIDDATGSLLINVFNPFSSSFSQSVINFDSASESIASEIFSFQSFSSSFSQSVINFDSASESIASEIFSFQSFSSSFSQSVINFDSASESIASEIINFQSFSSSFSQSVVNFDSASESIASEIFSFQSFSSSFSQSVVNFDSASESIASEIFSFQSFSSSFSQSVVNFDSASESIASEIFSFQSFSSSFSQSVINFDSASESIASEIVSFQSFSSSFSQSVVDFNEFSSSLSESFTTVNITASGNISASDTITMLTASIGGGIFTSASLANQGAGVGFPFSGSAIITGSLIVSGSGTGSGLGSVQPGNISASGVITANEITASLYTLNNSATGNISVIAPGSDPSDIILGSTSHQLDLRGEKIAIARLSNSGDVEIGRSDNNTIIYSSLTASSNISSSGDIIGVNITGTSSANTSVLQQPLTASLNTSVGTIDNGEAFPAGTSIEAILRSMLIDFIAPTITSFTITSLPSEMEAGDSITVTAGTFATSSDSNGEGFTGGINLVLTNNKSNTVNNFTVTSATALDFDDILVSQSEAKQVVFKLEATNSQADVATRNDTCNFRSPIFYGGSSNTGNDLDTTVLSSILMDISSSIISTTNASQIRVFDSSTGTFGTQTYLNNTSTTDLPSNTKISLPGSVQNSSNFTYIIYPSSYGELSQVLKNGVQDETGTFSLLGAVDHTRYTTIEYNVYRTAGQNAFESGDVLTLND